MQNGSLSGKTALVIGASSGIGLSTANLFADAGAKVHAAARRSDAIREGAEGRDVAAHALDISDGEAVRRVVEEVGESDGIDVLIVAAGMNFPERRLEQLTAEKWDAMISVNLSGAFYAVRAALPYLRASRGLVVLISSVSGSWPDASGPAYQASKAGMPARPSHSASSTPGGSRALAAWSSRRLWDPRRRLPEMPRIRMRLRPGRARARSSA
jgi:NAD(P)-dependent dehydrogenase (short-subunit alcohol dehydrogenase family)